MAIKNFTIPTGLDVVGAITATTTITANGVTLTGNTGTVTGVTGTAPISSSGGTAPAISISAATTSAAGSMSSTDKTKLDGIAANANNYSLPTATSTVLGGIELFSDTQQSVAANTVTATASRTYGIQLNAAGQAVVNVPWVDTDTNTTYSAATSTVAGLVELFNDTVQTVAANTASTTASRTYGIQVNAAGQMVVNVPWVDTDTVYSLPTATSTVLGGIELFSDTAQTVAATAVSATASRTYGLQLNAAGQGVINVPWTDTVYSLPTATSTVLGGIELFSDTQQSVAAEAVSATASRTYGIQVNAAGQAVVNVPWVDTNTDVNWNGGSTGLVAATGRTSLGATTLGGNLFQLTNVSAISFPRINADNTISTLDGAAFRTAIGAGTSSTSGTVTSVALSVPAFLSVSGSPITSSGTLAVSLSGTALPVANGGTGSTSPSLVQGTNISITGSWPNQTINASNSAGVSESLAIAYAVALG